MQTQADRLKELMQEEHLAQKAAKQTKFITVTSGKGGVGKSTISANIANLLAEGGYKVGLFDADIGLANLDVILNVRASKNLLHVLKGEAKLADIVVPVKENFVLIPGDSGAEILKYSQSNFYDALLEDSKMLEDLDFLIIDTGAGIGGLTQHFLEMADEVVLVTTPDPAAVTDAYATIKTCYEKCGSFRLLINMCKDRKEGFEVFRRINQVARAACEGKIELSYLGFLPISTVVSSCTREREMFSNSEFIESAYLKEAVNNLLIKLERKVLESRNDGTLLGFFKKLIDRI